MELKYKKRFESALDTLIIIWEYDDWFLQMGVSENGGTAKSSILIGISIINHPFWGIPILGNTQIGISFFLGLEIPSPHLQPKRDTTKTIVAHGAELVKEAEKLWHIRPQWRWGGL